MDQPHKGPMAHSAAKAGACTVFIVDADAAVAAALSSMLRTYAIDVYTYHSAEEFLAGYTPAENACLVAELDLPGLSGIELLERLRAMHSSLPVIITASSADVPEAVEAMRAGAVDFMEKPYSQERLLQRLGEALGQRVADRVA